MKKIGDFAKLFNVSIKTIRFYESKELLKPFYIDKYTGYRYYDEKNIEEMSRILYLKNLGFSLAEIKNYDETQLKDKINDFKNEIVKLEKNVGILESLNSGLEHEAGQAFVNDDEAIGKWKLIGISNSKEEAMRNEFENNISYDMYSLKTLYLLENGEKYWVISWSKGIIYINGQSNPYEIDGNRMYVNVVYPNSRDTYVVAVYEKVNGKKYEINEIRKKDKFNGYYKPDGKLIGFWKTIDYIKNGQRFNYKLQKCKDDFALERITVNPIDNSAIIYLKDGKSSITKYTKGHFLNMVASSTMSAYTCKRINGKDYMFVEWKDDDYVYGNRINGSYVLERIGGKYMDEMFEENEKIYNVLSREKCGLLLGKNMYLPADKRGNINTLVVAGSGAGKSAAYTKPNVLNMLGSYIVADTWKEVYNQTHKYLEQNGYKIITVNDEGGDYNYNYNPLNHLRSDSDVDILTDILINDEKDEFWNNASKCLVKCVIYYVLRNEIKKDLLTCFKLMSLPQNELFEKFEVFEENSKPAKYYAILKTFPEKTYLSIVSTAIMKLSFVINLIPEDRNYDEKIDFVELANNKTAVFLIDNESNADEKKLVSIFVAQFLSQFTVQTEHKEVVYLLLDEADRFGEIYNLPRNIETSRARRISISLITSNLNKLKNLYGDEFYTMVNSIDTQLLLGTNTKFDIEYFSDILGLDDEYIKNDLGRDKLLIAEKGLKPILASKSYFYENPEWV